MAGVFSELEREMIRERVNAGLARARREGKRLGRPPVQPALQRAIRAAGDKGLSVRAIAKKLKTSVGTVHRSLNAA
jgi:DNA invertase Pin-like site-specific DNA recombinase